MGQKSAVHGMIVYTGNDGIAQHRIWVKKTTTRKYLKKGQEKEGKWEEVRNEEEE